MPRTLAQNAQYIANTIKPAIKSAIEAQGVTVPSTDSFLDYADRIAEIEGGGSGYQLKDLPTGAIATVTDAAELPLNALKVSVEAWQDLHGYDHPWAGGAGKNKFGGEYNQFFPLHFSSDVVITASAAPASGGDPQIIFYDENQTQIDYWSMYQRYSSVSNRISRTFTYPTTAYFVKFTIIETTDYQIEVSSTNTTFSPYSNICPIIGWDSGEITVCDDLDNPTQTETITQQFPTTIYGAEWDVVGGGMKQTYVCLEFDGSNDEQWAKYTSGSASDFAMRIAVDSIASIITNENIANFKSNILKPITTVSTWGNADYWFSNETQRNAIVTGVQSITTVEAWKQFLAEKPLQIYYPLTYPTTIPQTPLSIRMLQGTNNIYADCGEVIEGEYFVDEGAIDVRKVDYQIGSSGSIKTTDGRVLSGFASMNGYHARPLDASGNWLDVDWSKDFEIGVAFKFTALPNYQGITGDGNANSYRKAPRLYYDNSEGKLALCVSSDGSTLAIDTFLNHTFVVDKWYFIKAKFVLSTLTFTVDITEDFSTFTNLYSGVMASAPYHNSASLCFGGDAQQSNMASNTFLVDTFNTYIKGDNVSWGAFTGAFPS